MPPSNHPTEGAAEYRDNVTVTGQVKIGGAIYPALWALKREIGAIAKSQKVQAGKRQYQFRGIDQVQSAISPLMEKHGVLLIPYGHMVRTEVVDIKTNYGERKMVLSTLEASYRLTSLEDGSYIPVSAVANGSDDSDKGLSSASSTAYKYALFEALCIPTEDQRDNDQRTEAQHASQEHAARGAVRDTPEGDQAAALADALAALTEFGGHLPETEKTVMLQRYYQVSDGAGLHALTAPKLIAGTAALLHALTAPKLIAGTAALRAGNP